MIPTLPEMYKIVDAVGGCITTNATVTGLGVTVKNATWVWLVVNYTQSTGHATTMTIQEATTVAGGSAKTTIAAHQIWFNASTAATDTLVRQTDATSFALSAGVAKMQVVWGIDPATMDIANNFDCLLFTQPTSAQAANFISANWYLQMRYAQATPPTAVID